jgi:hypothetical protein
MTNRNIQIIKLDNTITDQEIDNYITAQNTQIVRDVAPFWGTGVGVGYVPGETVARPGSSPLYLGGPSDVQGALGYHDEDANGHPYIKVFKVSGYRWETTASHEVLEFLGDEPANVWAMSDTAMVARELCDPVEGDAYPINGVPMSNFVLPRYFDPKAPSTAHFDFLNKLTAPFSMSPGGYMIVWDLTGSPTQRFGYAVQTVRPGLHIHFGPAVPLWKQDGIVAKYQKTGRR